MQLQNPFTLIANELCILLQNTTAALPELEAVRANPTSLVHSPQGRILLDQIDRTTTQPPTMPVTPYSAYRRFKKDGDRREYEAPYFQKRADLSICALRLFLGQTELLDRVHDYLWNICEETNWVLPAHETSGIDLFSAETGFLFAETMSLLGTQLDEEVRHRVRDEVDRRIFDPYLHYHSSYHWYQGGNNWNGVCNSSIAATFLLLEPEPLRMARGLELALQGLKVFLDTAFEDDGSSTEGVAYWHYGLINFVALSEMLRSRSNGVIDLLASDKMKKVAAYPARVQLSGSTFTSFSDCDEIVQFNPGIIARLAERTGESSLWNLLVKPSTPAEDWGLPMMLRNLLWWDGRQPDGVTLSDELLPNAGIVRLVARTAQQVPVAVAMKAGHNAENHNQNDVGSFIVNVGGENFLTDPGPGLYSRQYFSPQRYENVFANSYGHSVPRIDNQLQGTGQQFHGQLRDVDTGGALKRCVLEFGSAYAVDTLIGVQRELLLADQGASAGTLWLTDTFTFDGTPGEVEEAFVTWCAVRVDGNAVILTGKGNTVRMLFEEPNGVSLDVASLDEQCRANAKDRILRRIRVQLTPGQQTRLRLRIEVLT